MRPGAAVQAPLPLPQVTDPAWFASDLARELAAAAFAWCCVPRPSEPGLAAAVRGLAAAPGAAASSIAAAEALFTAFVATPPALALTTPAADAALEPAAVQAFRAAAAAVARLPLPRCRQVLVYARLWCVQYLPHVLRKTDRVGYGLLALEAQQSGGGSSGGGGGEGGGIPGGLFSMGNASTGLPSLFSVGDSSGDAATAALRPDPSIPLARRMLAVPFLAKDVPSPTSEFSHPEVRRREG